MRRKFNNLHSGGAASTETVNPLDGLANLADLMLVFACGLMLALIINWNVDVSGSGTGSAVSVERGREVSGLEGLGGNEGEPLDGDARYEELGVVYLDPNTGKMYMVAKE